MSIVYFSNVSENTSRFVEKLDLPAQRIPIYSKEQPLIVTEPYVLIVPTYGGGSHKGAVPVQVKKFLNNENNRSLARGVIASGNTNFGVAYCIAGDLISAKLNIPYLYRFELLGLPWDVDAVRDGLNSFWSNSKENNDNQGI